MLLHLRRVLLRGALSLRGLNSLDFVSLLRFLSCLHCLAADWWQIMAVEAAEAKKDRGGGGGRDTTQKQELHRETRGSQRIDDVGDTLGEQGCA